MAKINKVMVGESLVGDGNEVAHIDLILGPRGSALLYLLIALLAHGWLAVGAWQLLQPMAALWGLISLPLSLAGAWLIWRHAEKPAQLRPAIMLTIGAGAVHGLGMAGGLASMGWH